MSKSEKEDSYIRVGIYYYKLLQKPMLSGDTMLVYKRWSYHVLKQDKVNIKKILKYHDFLVYPEHINYRQVINGFFNKYAPLEFTPQKGECINIRQFLSHIFGEQIELGLDYLKILYEKPTQVLPILCLISSDRNTGKTTFLNFLKAIYGANMTINTNEDFRSQFNSGWSNCLIIGIDEALLDKKEDSERIKNLSTAKTYKEESKGVDKVEIEFFGKFILCSNKTKDFIKIDKNEIRYWVREVPTLTHSNNNLLQIMVKEIPQFLNYLIERDYSVPCQTRMWFTPQQIRTKALDVVKNHNRSPLEQQLLFIIRLIMETMNVAEVCFTLKDSIEWLNSFGCVNKEVFQLRTIIQDTWGLEPFKNSSNYTLYRFNKDNEPIEFKGKGRYYSINSTHLEF